MPTATVTSKGQLTIPVEVLRALRIHPGDKVDFVQNDEGNFSIRTKRGSIMEMKGILQRMGYAPLGYAPSIEEMNDAIADAIVEADDATQSDAG